MDGDAVADVVTMNLLTAAATVFAGHGDGTFEQVGTWPVGKGAVSFSIGDMNGDGRNDLVVSNSAAHNVTVILNTTR